MTFRERNEREIGGKSKHDQPPAEGRCVSVPDQLVNMGDVDIAALVCTYP